MKKSTALLFASGTVVCYIMTGLALSLNELGWAGVAFGVSFVVMAIGFVVKARSSRVN